MADLHTEVDSDELQSAKFRKFAGKRAGESAAQNRVKRFTKRKRRSRKTKLIKPTMSSASDFVSSSRRLTRRIGLFNNGKISTKVSRFEYVASAETKARVEQDLHKILNIASNNNGKMVDSDKNKVHHASTKKRSCCCKPVEETKETSPVQQSSSANYSVQETLHGSSSRMSNSSDKSIDILKSSEPKDSGIPKECNSTKHIEFSSVISRLHATLNKKCEELFPGISMKNNLKNELVTLQKCLIVKRTECNSTECLSCNTLSQASTSTPAKETSFSFKPQTPARDDHQSIASFKLDFHPPSLLPFSSAAKDETFSDSFEEDIFSFSEEKKYEKELQDYHSAAFDNSDLPPVSPLKKESRKLMSLVCTSPDSDGQPTWKPDFSPCRPTLESPSLWNYSRCKMY